MVINESTFHKAYDKIREGIINGSMRLQDYQWTGIVVDGQVKLWPTAEKRVKIYQSF